MTMGSHDPEVTIRPAGGRGDKSPLDYLKHNFREYGMLITLVAIMAFFQYMTGGTLMQPLNLTNLVLQNSYIVIMALGMLMVIVAGHIDLSVGSVCGFIGALAAVLMVQHEWHFVPASLLCLACGALIGATQGWFIAFFRIPPSSSPWPACWCSRGWRWPCCRASPWARFPTPSSCSAPASCPTC
jgi:putative multiple sugar transport system permease protein